jgi:predicted transposase YdaD
MAQRFDAILKHLPEAYPQDWARFAGVNSPVSVMDADVSTVSAAADKVLRVEERSPWILHLEFQASRDAKLGRRLLHYNVLLGVRHALAVRSVALLLRPQADGRELTGQVRWNLPGRQPYLEFDYEVIRLWELPPEELLAGGLGTLPLAPLTRVKRPELPEVIRVMEGRLDREADRATANSLWTATYVLLGLEYDEEFTRQLLRGVRSMKESVTYQAILKEGREEGREEEALRILLALGTKRFGKPTAKIRRSLAQITDRERLEDLATQILDVRSWADLLADRN